MQIPDDISEKIAEMQVQVLRLRPIRCSKRSFKFIFRETAVCQGKML